jgi:formyltetrahydrofolate synthetase
MIFVALVLAGCQTLVLACFAFLAVRWYRSEAARIRDEVSEALRTFVTAPDDKTPSPLAVATDMVAMLLAARFMQQLKAMMAGVESGESKAEKDAMIDAATANSPWLALLANIIPKRLRNQLMKNPQMIGALANLGRGNHSADATPSGVQRTFEL